jgi:osmotically-inducible protein OsmY
MTDIELADAVGDALRSEVLAPARKIHCTVEDGVVTVMGDVETARDRDTIDTAIRWVSGVRGIANELVVRAAPVDPPAVHAAIKVALERHVARAVERIAIEVRGDTVALTGAVESPAERSAIVGAARGTRGIRFVVDHLRVV